MLSMVVLARFLSVLCMVYGTVAGIVDGGFRGFDNSLDTVFLLANGNINYEALHMMGYRGIGEMKMIGKEFAKAFYDMGDDKVYTYYQSCSEGGREGWSQAQNYPGVYDGVIPGAPAIRYGQQQANHFYSNVMQKTLDYYPRLPANSSVSSTPLSPLVIPPPTERKMAWSPGRTSAGCIST